MISKKSNIDGFQHKINLGRTLLSDVCEISPTECPKQTATKLGPQITYVVNINQTNLILFKELKSGTQRIS